MSWYNLTIPILNFKATLKVVDTLVTEMYDLRQPQINILGPSTFEPPYGWYTASNIFVNGFLMQMV